LAVIDEEEELLRSVALQNASAVLLARQRAELNLIQAKELAEGLAAELQIALRRAQLGADVGKALTRAEPLSGQLRACASAITRHLDAALARIWTVSADGSVLELQASAGLYNHVDGPHGRVPMGAFKIGRIAQQRKPHWTNVRIPPNLGTRSAGTWALVPAHLGGIGAQRRGVSRRSEATSG
jgi:hypothetical protein